MTSLLPAHFVGSGQAVGFLSISAAAVDEHTADPLHSGGSQLLFLKADVSLGLRQEPVSYTHLTLPTIYSV